MQRKNCILERNSYKKSRNGIAMIMAIIVIVIIATILTLSLQLSTQTSKKTVDLYLYEQAALLSHSATEYTMLKISQATPCSIDSLDFNYNGSFDINASMHYISVAGSACDTNASIDGTDLATVTYPSSDGATVIIDIAVSVPKSLNITSEPIKYFRRTIQKL
ncbi:MAG: hypothetical protein COA30_03425 [Sulfurimonas sp.]|nr:MAG: hypothetical protein COA30_03425 [Sulfurimonas sp.]